MKTAETTTAVVCRGCCCGTARKHPATDHDRQILTLARAVARIPSATMEVVGCLGICRHSNVVAVARRTGRDWDVEWFERILDQPDVEALCAYLHDPGAMPARLARRRFDAPRPAPAEAG